MRFTGTLALGIVLAIGVAVAEDRAPSAEVKPEREASMPTPSAPDTADASLSWTQRVLSALGRLRLNPGHDYIDRDGARSFRP